MFCRPGWCIILPFVKSQFKQNTPSFEKSDHNPSSTVITNGMPLTIQTAKWSTRAPLLANETPRALKRMKQPLNRVVVGVMRPVKFKLDTAPLCIRDMHTSSFIQMEKRTDQNKLNACSGFVNRSTSHTESAFPVPTIMTDIPFLPS